MARSWSVRLSRDAFKLTGFMPIAHLGEHMPLDIYYVVIACPNTGRAARTGVELTDLSEFAFAGLMPQTFDCQHCYEAHTWSNKDAWIEKHQASRLHVRPALAGPKS